MVKARGIAPVHVQALLGVLFLFATGMAIWEMSAHQAAHREAARQHASRYAKDAEQRVAKACTNRQAPAYAQCVAEIIEATRESQRAEHELSAAREVADWTLIAVLLSAAAIVISGAGLVFLVRTVEQGREGLEHAREVSRAQLRPWLTDDAFDANATGTIVGDKILNMGIRARLKFINSGQSPAKNVFLFNSQRLLPATEPPPVFSFKPVPDDADVAKGSVGPGKKVNGAWRQLSPQEFAAFKARVLVLWLYAYLKYDDPSDNDASYHTEVTFRLEYSHDETGEEGLPIPRVQGMPIGPGNNLS